ncbi:hypothetical protein NECAME_01748 [Necator americanus]|uniref:Myosin motor domain-containing protein n=1 Tax=Necator americanus TaxID=51031 RepID=W2TQP4_NECAM|nr:hypothetical protein NECAME_01748 [Necator americanus]ETN83441.1 hypothetical protein NECAME_01748 [Necator americanus]
MVAFASDGGGPLTTYNNWLCHKNDIVYRLPTILYKIPNNDTILSDISIRLPHPTDTSEERVLSEIEDRFNKKRIYTNVGGVLLFINPFEKYSIYDESVIAQYQQFNKYAGESSSGKSFNAYQVMKYLATSHNSKVTVKHIDAITTIFNSFGCAKTVKNDDATRFGYCMDFLYNK